MTEQDYRDEVRRIRPLLIDKAGHYLDDDEAEDTVQDVFLRLWQMLDELRSPMLPLALRMVRNLAVDKLRRKRHTMNLTDIDGDSQSGEDNALIEKMLQLMETLPPLQQTLLRLRHMEGMETKDLATLTGSTEMAIRKALSRARKTLLLKMNERT